MSAIAGILQFDGSAPDRGLMQNLASAMSSAGPDGAGHWHAGPVALAHCMLRTTREAAGETQPLCDKAAGVTIVFDGRLDNREELQRALAAQGLTPRTPADAELVLRAYQVWGDDSPARLLGDFAYALWDARRQVLLCVVDPMGAERIYYISTARLFAFASTDEALLALPGVAAEPDEDRIACMLVPQLRPIDPSQSWLRNIRVLAPGQLLRVAAAGRTELSTYWRLEAGDELALESPEQAQAEFLAVFAEAVRCRLRASAPVAQMLSGGLDSAGIRAMMGRIGAPLGASGELFPTYSAISDDADACEETQCIRSMTAGAAAHLLAVPSFRGIASVDDLVHEAWSHAHPVDNSITLPALMCLAASRNGHRIMLHGVSGDVTLGVPNRYIADAMRDRAWSEAWAECRQASVNHTYLRGTPAAWLFLLNAWTAAGPPALKRTARLLKARTRGLETGTLNGGLARRLQITDRLRSQRQPQAGSPTPSSPREEQVQLVGSANGLALGLSGFGRLGKRYGLDMRDPWADRRVVEFFLRLPLRLKIQDGWTKYLVRTSFQGDLAPQVRWRRGKEHLGWQFTVRLMKESKSFVAQTLHDELRRLAPYVDVDFASEQLRRYLRPSLPEAASDAETGLAYDLMVLILWLKRLESTKSAYTSSQSRGLP